jgi:hypothetical protein
LSGYPWPLLGLLLIALFVAHDMVMASQAVAAPLHESIALAQLAQDRLIDERLVAIAENIISTQQAEIEELQGY